MGFWSCLLALFACVWFPFSAEAKVASLSPEPMTFVGVDGVKIVADFYGQKNKQKVPCVILLHMLGHNRATYDCLVSPLVDNGYAVLALDLPGHGDSLYRTDGKLVDFRSFQTPEWLHVADDVSKIIWDLQSKPGIDHQKLAIVGASIGANTAALVGGKNQRVQAVVMLSPGLNYFGVQPGASIQQFKRPVLVVCGTDDKLSLESSKSLAQMAGGRGKLILLDNAGHGTDMFVSHPELINQVVAFLTAQVPAK